MQRRWRFFATTALIAAGGFWNSAASADKFALCFASERFICGNNGKGSATFVKMTELEVKTMSEDKARRSAQSYCKTGADIRKVSVVNNGVYFFYEFDCDKK